MIPSNSGVNNGRPARQVDFASIFLCWEAEQPDRHEFYRGETFAMVGGSARHNRVILNLASRIGNSLILSRIDLKLPMAQVFKGVEAEAA